MDFHHIKTTSNGGAALLDIHMRGWATGLGLQCQKYISTKAYGRRYRSKLLGNHAWACAGRCLLLDAIDEELRAPFRATECAESWQVDYLALQQSQA